MVFLGGFEHDVFISYAHIDDRPDREGERGWVESLERALSLRLLKRFGREVTVWRDPALARSQRFDPVIGAAVRRSALVVALLSKSYLASAYCRQELAWFASEAEQGAFGLAVDHRVRIFPLLLYNLPPDEWPEPCRGTSGFRFHDATEGGFGKPLDPHGDDFLDRLCELVEEIHALLTAMERNAAPSVMAEAVAAPSRSVFLADVADDMRTDRQYLRRQLEDEGMEVLAGIPPPYGEADHAAATAQAMQRAQLSIHLLGSLPGRPVDEEKPESTYPVEQLRIGLDRAPSQLVMLPPGLDGRDVRDGSYAGLLATLHAREREADSFEIAQIGREQHLALVLAKLRRLDERRRPHQSGSTAGTIERAFVDVHVNDLPSAGELVGYLQRQRVPAVTIPSADVDPALGLSLFEEYLRSARVFIVVFGRVARGWVEQRLNEACKLILAKRLPTRVGVYLAPPHKSHEDVLFPPFFEVMNNSERFDPATVDALLTAPAGTT